jgi:chromosome segregation ATPase
MASNELWNVNTLELLSTITAANEPSSSTATFLSTEVKMLEATRATKKAELDGFTLDHKDLDTRSKATKTLLDKDEAVLKRLASETQTLLAATHHEKATLARLTEQIETLLKTATPLHEAIKKIETQLDEKVTEANSAKQLEATAGEVRVKPRAISKYITETVLSLTQPFNTGYRVKYPFFVPILALC